MAARSVSTGDQSFFIDRPNGLQKPKGTPIKKALDPEVTGKISTQSVRIASNVTQGSASSLISIFETQTIIIQQPALNTQNPLNYRANYMTPASFASFANQIYPNASDKRAQLLIGVWSVANAMRNAGGPTQERAEAMLTMLQNGYPMVNFSPEFFAQRPDMTAVYNSNLNTLFVSERLLNNPTMWQKAEVFHELQHAVDDFRQLSTKDNSQLSSAEGGTDKGPLTFYPPFSNHPMTVQDFDGTDLTNSMSIRVSPATRDEARSRVVAAEVHANVSQLEFLFSQSGVNPSEFSQSGINRDDLLRISNKIKGLDLASYKVYLQQHPADSVVMSKVNAFLSGVATRLGNAGAFQDIDPKMTEVNRDKLMQLVANYFRLPANVYFYSYGSAPLSVLSEGNMLRSITNTLEGHKH